MDGLSQSVHTRFSEGAPNEYSHPDRRFLSLIPRAHARGAWNFRFSCDMEKHADSDVAARPMHACQAESTELVKTDGFSKGNNLRVFRLKRGIGFSWFRHVGPFLSNHSTLQRTGHPQIYFSSLILGGLTCFGSLFFQL